MALLPNMTAAVFVGHTVHGEQVAWKKRTDMRCTRALRGLLEGE